MVVVTNVDPDLEIKFGLCPWLANCGHILTSSIY